MNAQAKARAHGFTLIELMTVVALIAIVASLSAGLLARSGVAVRASSAPLELSTLIQNARNQAALKGRPVVLVVMQASGTAGQDADQCSGDVQDARCARWWLMVDEGPRFTLAGFTASSPGSAGDTVLDQGTLGRGVRLGTGTGYTAMTPPAPFATLPAPSLGCSFCDTALSPPRGVIRFSSQGEVTFDVVPVGSAGAVLFVTGGHANDTAGLGITAPAGLITTRFQVNR